MKQKIVLNIDTHIKLSVIKEEIKSKERKHFKKHKQNKEK